jgi:hypothetical protein
MVLKEFKHERMNSSLYGQLETPRQSAAFVCLVMDYIEYLRSDPERRNDSWDERQEMATAQEFVKMINNDVAWPLARQYVPEFKTRV